MPRRRGLRGLPFGPLPQHPLGSCCRPKTAVATLPPAVRHAATKLSPRPDTPTSGLTLRTESFLHRSGLCGCGATPTLRTTTPLLPSLCTRITTLSSPKSITWLPECLPHGILAGAIQPRCSGHHNIRPRATRICSSEANVLSDTVTFRHVESHWRSAMAQTHPAWPWAEASASSARTFRNQGLFSAGLPFFDPPFSCWACRPRRPRTQGGQRQYSSASPPPITGLFLPGSTGGRAGRGPALK